MNTIILILAYIMTPNSIYMYFVNNDNNMTHNIVKVKNEVYLKADTLTWIVTNKATEHMYEKQYKGKNKNIDQDKLYEATNNLKLINSNNSILNAIKSVFTPSEIEELKNENLIMILRINNNGKILFITFGVRSDKLKKMSLSKYSLLENKLISTMKFKVTDPDIEIYTLNLRLIFEKIYNNTYVFPQDRYVNH